MKITSILLAFLVAASFSFAQEKKEEKKKADPAAAFAKKDKNGDGKLSKEEFTAGAKDAAKSEQQFTARDKDKDGSVSKEEFTAAGGKKKKDGN
jgi:Ca2+-binding EF-hand superfamily protein